MTVQVVNAFTGGSANGNPAAVVILASWLCDQALLSISQQAAQPVTAFVVARDDGYDIRWFSPEKEISLCGHGALAAAAWVMTLVPSESISFFSTFGNLEIDRVADGYRMKMPAWRRNRDPQLWQEAESMGFTPLDVFSTRDLIIVLESAAEVRHFQPDFERLRPRDPLQSVILTAADGETGYVLRNFAPKIGINEDIATGSAQCSLAPYWLERLGQPILDAQQCSSEGGYFRVMANPEGIDLIVQAELTTQMRRCDAMA
ncbi:PhzF family phenazine biosynthesis protein (plasmid) [Photobacterium sp. GJ3]|nr:PhzF family phenazine biosynthesis protein [Photobacterium sp. GJ3]